MIDYLCLKLGCLTETILDNAHFDNVRKMRLYVALDQATQSRPIIAIPILDNKSYKKALEGYEQAEDVVRKLMGLIRKQHQIDPETEKEMKSILRQLVPGLKTPEEIFAERATSAERPPQVD